MNNKIIVIGITFVLVSLGLCGCSEQNKFVGEWIDNDGDTHHFFSDGTFNSISGSQTQSGSWEVKDNKLVITVQGQSLTYSYSFSNNDNTLKLSGIKDLTLTRQ